MEEIKLTKREPIWVITSMEPRPYGRSQVWGYAENEARARDLIEKELPKINEPGFDYVVAECVYPTLRPMVFEDVWYYIDCGLAVDMKDRPEIFKGIRGFAFPMPY